MKQFENDCFASSGRSNIIEPHHNCSKVTVQSNFSKATVQRQLFKIIPTVARKKCDCSELLKITVGVKKIKTIQSPYEKNMLYIT